ncbi:hypothetical protein E9549_13070 [Blastococcus sp. MG754426]|uniref:HelD family protein n=1 Tax=unclassified Blastococcus TaxID=2619396 RepID=UPI001EF06117|nr:MULTISPECIES: AAA family ATPase [unclassified Blastococcus]MCF6508329.1 hypothetical protein [Blastococcus sp. MG754426]MCF6513037.1 hypothetical protein [Blastococcus sp. MG754427]MCF6734082.1 hypothetical protein [Blastococcus sp. KM273129]
MTTANRADLALEQEHFDLAWEARERKRRTLQGAPSAAAGPRAAVSAVKKGADRLLESIGAPDEPVAFGRFDLADGEAVYVGKHLIANDSHDPLVINWRTDFAAPYFTATYDDPRGLTRRRKFQTTKNTVDDFEELVFEDLARRIGELSGLEQSGIDDAVLRDLEQHRTGEMRDIVQTIHASQYELIRLPLERLLIVQGGPGTGKTAVALHRVSWLLFNNRDRLTPEQVLVVGPNPTFTKYIRSVLPGLGDADVIHRDLRGLGPQPSSGRLEDPATARLKGDARMADLLDRALMQRVRVPDGLTEVLVGPERGGVRIPRPQLESALERYSSQGTYASGRAAFRRWVNEGPVRRAAETVTPTQIESAVERLWPSLSPQAFLRDLLGSRERLLAAAGDDFTGTEIGRLVRQQADRLSGETWSDADVALLDEADALINGPGPRFGHIVVDEAQDLAPMQLRSLARRSAEGSMTLVGDLAQSTGAWARDSWDDVAEALEKAYDVQIEELSFGYRVPRQVFELAARLLPQAAPDVTPPRVVREGPEAPQLVEVDEEDRLVEAVRIAQERAGQGLFVGLVCPDTLRDDLVARLKAKRVTFSDASAGGIGASINLVSPADAKGLEFDSVVVVEPEAIVAEHQHGLRMLYVALTRTTQHLAVVHTGALLPLEELPVALVASDSAAAAIAPSLEMEGPEEGAVAAVGSQPLNLDEPATREQVRVEWLPPTRPPLTTPPAAGLDAVSELVVGAVTGPLAQTIRASVPPGLWPRLLDRLREELGLHSAAPAPESPGVPAPAVLAPRDPDPEPADAPSDAAEELDLAGLEAAFDKRVKDDLVKHGSHINDWLSRNLGELGGVGFAKFLLARAEPVRLLYTLARKRLLLYSIEAAVLDPRFAPLFTAEELWVAERRLSDLGYTTESTRGFQ